jgi:hypothetical protein
MTTVSTSQAVLRVQVHLGAERNVWLAVQSQGAAAAHWRTHAAIRHDAVIAVTHSGKGSVGIALKGGAVVNVDLSEFRSAAEGVVGLLERHLRAPFSGREAPEAGTPATGAPEGVEYMALAARA